MSRFTWPTLLLSSVLGRLARRMLIFRYRRSGVRLYPGPIEKTCFAGQMYLARWISERNGWYDIAKFCEDTEGGPGP